MKAYPFIHKHPTSGQTSMAEGMDLRDYFAGLAMQAALSRGSMNYEDIAMYSYKYADVMMKAREVKNDQP
jgi:hypothetical protein